MSKKPSFLSPAVTASATGNPRNKVALKPGRSLMDWIKLTHKEPDLAGTGGKIRAVTRDELKNHNKPGDLWICIRGKVYNVTAYLEYHPGGEDELLRGAGKDATRLFNEAHAWVNYDTMLKKCLIGPYKSSGKGTQSNKVTLPGSLEPVKNGIFPKVSHNWSQSSTTVTIVFTCKTQLLSTDRLTADVLEDGSIIRCRIRLGGWTYIIHQKLYSKIEPEVDISLAPDKTKLDITLLKATSGSWNHLGDPLPGHGALVETDDLEPGCRNAKMVYKEDLTHNTRLFCIKLEDSSKVGVPLGHHLQLSIKQKDEVISRFYTPIDPALTTEFKELSPNLLYFIIKIYSLGRFTQALDRLPEGSDIEVGDALGSFQEDWLEQWEQLILLSAGTGITPMIRIINTLLSTRKNLDVRLMAFNKTEQDIIWREQLDKMATNIETFRVAHVLSEASPAWAGPTGRVRASLIKSHSSNVSNKTGILVCGPTPFMNAALSSVKECNISEEQVFIFSG